jgi:hypothetical protein
MITLYLVIGCNNQDGGKEYEVYADYTDVTECLDALYEAAEIYDKVAMKSVDLDPKEFSRESFGIPAMDVIFRR